MYNPLKMAKYPSISVVFDRRHSSSASKRGTVEIAVSYNGSRFYYNTGVRVFLNQWSGNKKICKGFDSAVECNTKIRGLVAFLSEKVELLWKTGEFSLQSLKESLRQKSDEVVEPIAWIRHQAEVKDVRESTRRHIFIAIDALERCGIFSSWDDFTYANIKKFDEFVRKRGIKQATVRNYHKSVKPFIDDAVKHKLLEESPYSTFIAARGERSEIEYLTDEERERIETVPLISRYDKVRDCFVFSCYTGMCFSDMKEFSRSSIIERDGVRYISSKRKKTGNKFLTILPDKAYSILEKYKFHLPINSNQSMNRYLKDIALLARIEKNVTMHVARHTFATWALHNGIPLSTVSRTLGHTSVKTTEIYAKVIEDDVMNQISKLK